METQTSFLSVVQTILIWYYVLLNAILFLLMGYDKLCAKKGKRRVPEATLFLLAVLGGAFGGLCSMPVFHHKTKHVSFWLLYSVSFLLHLVLFWFVWRGIFFPVA